MDADDDGRAGRSAEQQATDIVQYRRFPSPLSPSLLLLLVSDLDPPAYANSAIRTPSPSSRSFLVIFS